MGSKDQGLRQVEELLRKDIDTTQYDPHQNEDERRLLRSQYRELQEQTFGIHFFYGPSEMDNN